MPKRTCDDPYAEPPFDEEGERFAPDDLLIDKGPVSGQPAVPSALPRPNRSLPQRPPTGATGRPGHPAGTASETEQTGDRGGKPSFLGAPEEYELPPLRLLAEPKAGGKVPGLSADALEQNARILEGVLEDFGVRGEIIEVRPGPVVTLYELEPAPGIKSSRVIGLADDIARSMSAISARVAVIPRQERHRHRIAECTARNRLSARIAGGPGL